MCSRNDLTEPDMLETFLPLCHAVSGVELSDVDAAQAELTRRLDPAGPEGQRIAAEMVRLCEAGEIANRGELPVKWGRVAKPTPETLDHSIDVVLMNGAGPKHRHPTGEVSFAIALDGDPRFDGQRAGWVVLPPDSVHVPTVTGGTMLIAYLLPQGAMEFLETV